MARPPEPIFLGRETYRRRRLIDAIRLLPVFGIGFLIVPALGAADGERATAMAGLYIFGVWFALIVGAALLARRLAHGAGGLAADPLEPAPPAAPPSEASGE